MGNGLTGAARIAFAIAHGDLFNRDQRDGIQPRGEDGRWVDQTVHKAVESHNEGKREHSQGKGQASHLTLRKATPEDFCKALNEAGHSGANSWMVDTKTPEDLEGAKCFLSHDKKCGVAVEEDGNIVGLFRAPDSKYRGAAVECMYTAIRNGGTHGDCFMNESDGVGLHSLYQRLGFEFTSGTDFYAPYAPEGWKKGMAEPPVGFFRIPDGFDVKEAGRRAGLPEDAGGFHQASLDELRDRFRKSGTWFSGEDGYGKAGDILKKSFKK